MSGLGLIFLRRGNLAHPTAGSDYIKFKDEAVFNVLMAKGVSSDGIGITRDDAARVTTLSTWFTGNTEISSFEELKYFINIQSLNADTFNGCSSLTKVSIPHGLTASNNADHGVFRKCTSLTDVIFEDDSITTIPAYAFQSCSALKNITLPSSINRIEQSAFQSCSALTTISNWHDLASQITYIGGYAFRSVPLDIGDKLVLPMLQTLGGFNLNASSIKYVLDLGSITTLNRSDGGLFSDNKTELIILPKTMSNIVAYSLYKQNALTKFIVKATTPPTLGLPNAKLSNCTIYVPDSSVDAYKEATNWSSRADKIKGISEFATDNPLLYEEVKDYL